VHDGLEGRVETTSGKPLEHSRIIVDGVPLIKRTSHDGRFYLPLPAGHYAIEVAEEGYFNMTKFVTVLPEDPRVSVLFQVDGTNFLSGAWSTIALFIIVAQVCYNGTLFGRGQRLRRKGFMPVATYDDAPDDTLLFKGAKDKSPLPLATLNGKALNGELGGYSDLRALELSSSDADSEEEIYQPQFHSFK
ncbi:putative carboxypeptidase X1-like, partial [Tropilaelaps mercedesae]